MQIHFSDFFGVSPRALEKYGAFNVSLIGDLPLFVDPFLLFNSKNPAYQELHSAIIRYMRFLKSVTLSEQLTGPLIQRWFKFPEVKQNWLGFSRTGNKGHGLGEDFARALHRNFGSAFRDFGEETVTRSSHLEKLCLVRDGVGRDTISDFTTNLIKRYLTAYTEQFAREALPARLRRKVAVPKVEFNYETRSWMGCTVELPFINGDFVLLTPKDILTKDEAWINRGDLLDRLEDVADSMPDSVLRAQVNDYLHKKLAEDPKASAKQIKEAKAEVIEQFPAVLDHYIRDREEHGRQAEVLARDRVRAGQDLYVDQISDFARTYLDPGGFYRIGRSTYEEARNRVMFLKDVIENQGGQGIFYVKGRPIQRETDLHLLYRLTWYATSSDISREVNDGRGPADFKASRGSTDKVLVEFKLAKNTSLERNLVHQTPVYERASGATHPSLKVIVHFSDEELERVMRILRKLRLANDPHVILIDADATNKPSGSKAGPLKARRLKRT